RLHGGGVKAVGPAGGAESPQVEHCGRHEQGRERRPDPPRVGAGGAVGARAERRTVDVQGGGKRGHEALRGRKTQPRRAAKRRAVANRLATTSTAASMRRPAPGAATPSKAREPAVTASAPAKTTSP